MSDAVAAVRYLLANNAGLTAQVAVARIMAGVLPQGSALPAVSVMHVSTTRGQNLSAASGMATSRVQVTVHAATYPVLRQVLDLVRAAVPRSRGTVNGVYVDGILPDAEGPDFTTTEPAIYHGSQDFVVTFTE